MFTLHDTIELTKKILLYVAIGAAVIFILIMLFRFGGYLKDTFFPTPPPAAQVGFGALPAIDFGESQEGDFTYSVDTLTGVLPVLQDRVNVYKLEQHSPEFFDLSRAKTKAKTMGFASQPKSIGENVYQWSNNTELQPALTMDTLTGDFSFTSKFMTYNPILTSTNALSTNTAVSQAISFLESVNSYPESINTATNSATPLTIQNGALVRATSISNAQVIRVDFSKHVIDKLPIYFTHSPNSLIYVMIAGGGTNNSRATVVESKYINKEITDESSDYPIKTADEAFAELQAGKGHVASYFGNSNAVNIKDVQLGYFMSNDPQEYLLPIFVFIGDDGYLGYVSALQNDLIE